jgi:AraC-like DNA-binding protein
VFKAATGLSPNDFLQRHRIEVAREQLANPRRTITNIAMSTGFNSSQYFSNVFQKYCGMTPSEYRTQLCR